MCNRFHTTVLLIMVLLVGTVLGQNSNTTLIGRWAMGPCNAVDVAGNYAYINAGAAVIVADISDPSNPVQEGRVITPSTVQDVVCSNDYLYVADEDSGLRIIDMSNPANPVETGYYDTGGYALGVAVSGSYAYVAAGDSGLRIIDVSDPASPVETGFYDTGGLALGVAVSGSYAYVADAWGGLRIIDVSAPASPVETGFYDTGGDARGVMVSGSYAYVADAQSGLYIIRNDLLLSTKDEGLSLPKSLTLHQNYPNPFNPVTTIQFDLPAADNVALIIYDILGREVARLEDRMMPAGSHQAVWSGRTADGRAVPSGIYIIRLVTPGYSKSIKMLLLK